MKRSQIFIFCVTLLLASLDPISSSASISPASQKKLAEALVYFQKGAYSQAADLAKTIQSEDSETIGTVSFFIASAYAKMQDFDKALPYYAKAERANHNAPSLHFDYGQAFYATQKLKEAENQFRKSIVKKFKMGACAYYIGYIRQTLDEKPVAQDFYHRLQKLSQDPDQVKQPALVQLAEMEKDRVDEIKDKKKRLKALENEVLPLYKIARDFESGTPSYDEADKKMAAIQAELDAVVERMRNGVPLPKKPYALTLSQDFTFDSNVTTQADQALIQVSDKNSLISKTAVFGKYQFNWRETWSIVPELNSSISFHSRRSTPKVYQNDNISISPAIRTKLEHTSLKQPATMLLEAEFNLMLRDYAQAHQFPFYSRYWNFTLGERVKWFNTGTTTLKLSIKFSENYNPSRNSYSPAASLQQNVKIAGKWDLSNTLSGDYLHARDDSNDEKNYKIKSSVALTKLFEKVTVTPGFSLSYKDTMKQKATRGIEKTISPSVGFNRDLFKNFDGTLEYTFTKNISKSKTLYQYTKHEVRFGMNYNF